MRFLSIGHAGLFIESRGTSVLCDPWFTPAYFASWFPFPDNAGIDVEAIGSPTYLYVSHLHRDHFDPEFLAKHVSKDAAVLLPDYPLDELRRELEALGFTRFIQTQHGKSVELEGMEVAICTATTPADGPLGDSTISVGDGEVRLLNQNDCRPTDLELLTSFGEFDVHLLQYSGAIWYPMCNRFDLETRERLGRTKRANQIARALNYVKAVGASHVVPFAGPPAFLDDGLFELNDLSQDPVSIFVDQPVFLSYLEERGVKGGRLMITGSQATVTPGSFTVEHPVPDEEVERIFSDKKSYLQDYRGRRLEQCRAVTESLPHSGPDLVETLAEWVEPLLAGADRVCRNLGGPIVIDAGATKIAIDPVARKVTRWDGREWNARFFIAEPLLRALVHDRAQDWVNSLFLSCRFEVEYKGGYNGTIFSFFKCLAPERMAYLERSLSPSHQAAIHRLTAEQKAKEGETWRCGDHILQRRCPHLGGDLARFSEVEGKILTCTMHGWKFDLETGKCLTSDKEKYKLETRPVGTSGEAH